MAAEVVFSATSVRYLTYLLTENVETTRNSVLRFYVHFTVSILYFFFFFFRFQVKQSIALAIRFLSTFSGDAFSGHGKSCPKVSSGNWNITTEIGCSMVFREFIFFYYLWVFPNVGIIFPKNPRKIVTYSTNLWKKSWKDIWIQLFFQSLISLKLFDTDSRRINITLFILYHKRC